MRKLLVVLISALMLLCVGCDSFTLTNDTIDPIPTVHKEVITNIGESTTVNGIEVGLTGAKYDEKKNNLILYFHFVNTTEEYRDLGMNDVTTNTNDGKKFSNFYGCHIDGGEEADGKIEIGVSRRDENVVIKLFYYHTDTPFLELNTEVIEDVFKPTPTPTPIATSEETSVSEPSGTDTTTE